MVTEPFDLICINVRRTHLNRGRQVNDDGIFRCRREYGVDRITNRDGKIQFSASETFGAVLENPFRLGARICRFLDKAGAIDSDIANTIAIEAKNILPLHGGRTVVKVNNGTLYPLESRKGFLYQVGSGLRQHLHGDAVGNSVLINQLA